MRHPAMMPALSDPSENARWESSRLRRRMLYGQWRGDLLTRVKEVVGSERAEAFGRPDMSSNVFSQVCGQLAILYDETPIPQHEDQAAAKQMTELLEEAGWAPLMQRFQRDCIGLREMLMRVRITDDGELVLRGAFPDCLTGTADDDDPETLTGFRELRVRRYRGETVYAWDVVDVVDRENPQLRVELDDGTDITPAILGGIYSGDAYPYRNADGRPVLDGVLYHAARTGLTWDHTSGEEVVEGTLQAGVHWTFFGHTLMRASWPQRWMANGRVTGGTVQDRGGATVERVVADPATVLQIASDGEDAGNQVQVGQWGPGAEPLQVYEAAAKYEQRVATWAGISASDFVRTSGDPRSGYALAISREARIETARKASPVFARADRKLLQIISILWNRKMESLKLEHTPLPEGGWRITYPVLTPPETKHGPAKEPGSTAPTEIEEGDVPPPDTQE